MQVFLSATSWYRQSSRRSIEQHRVLPTSMQTSRPHRVRTAIPDSDDLDFIVAAFDSTLPYLTLIGAGEMWGSQPFSQRDGFVEDIQTSIKQSEDYLNSGVLVLIAEQEPDILQAVHDQDQGKDCWQPVAAAIIRDTLPNYLTTNASLVPILADAEDFLHIEAMVAHCHVGKDRHRGGGAGAAIINEVRERANAKGKVCILTDCWAGNGRGLNE